MNLVKQRDSNDQPKKTILVKMNSKEEIPNSNKSEMVNKYQETTNQLVDQGQSTSPLGSPIVQDQIIVKVSGVKVKKANLQMGENMIDEYAHLKESNP